MRQHKGISRFPAKAGIHNIKKGGIDLDGSLPHLASELLKFPQTI